MSTDLIPVPPDKTGLTPPIPEQPGSWFLKEALNQILRPHPDIALPRGYRPDVQSEAKAALARIERFAAPVSEGVLRAWLAPIPTVVRNEKSPEAIAGWIAGVTLAIGYLECAGFTAMTQREALHRFKFFPSAADIAEIVVPPATKVREYVRALRVIIDAPTEGGAA